MEYRMEVSYISGNRSEYLLGEITYQDINIKIAEGKRFVAPYLATLINLDNVEEIKFYERADRYA